MDINNKHFSLAKRVIFSVLGYFIMTEAHAEYYIVYPASTAVAPCYSCAPPPTRTVYVYRARHVHHHHYRHYYRPYHPHRHRSSASISVYYLIPPCGCTGCCNYNYQPCPGCSTFTPSCDSEGCDVDTNTCYNDLDRRTADDVCPDLQVTGD